MNGTAMNCGTDARENIRKTEKERHREREIPNISETSKKNYIFLDLIFNQRQIFI